MHIKTASFELEYRRGHSVYVCVNLKDGTWEMLRDWTGAGLSTKSWTPRFAAAAASDTGLSQSWSE
ncbi:hypothetical protein J2046_001359 [Rhizobium petrolearium]|nr:hypothetical protein [Neorhizobium petrolearium]